MWHLSPVGYWLYQAAIFDQYIQKYFGNSQTVLFSLPVWAVKNCPQRFLKAEILCVQSTTALLWTQHYITMIDYSSRNHARLRYELWMQHNTPVAVYPTLWCKPGTLSANRGSLSLITKPDSSECWQFLALFHLGVRVQVLWHCLIWSLDGWVVQSAWCLLTCARKFWFRDF